MGKITVIGQAEREVSYDQVKQPRKLYRMEVDVFPFTADSNYHSIARE